MTEEKNIINQLTNEKNLHQIINGNEELHAFNDVVHNHNQEINQTH